MQLKSALTVVFVAAGLEGAQHVKHAGWVALEIFRYMLWDYRPLLNYAVLQFMTATTHRSPRPLTGQARHLQPGGRMLHSVRTD